VDNNCKAELVITPPKQYGDQLAQIVSARTTLGVLTQLVAGAEVHIMIASPFFQASEGLEANPLASALKFATLRGVNVEVISTREGIAAFKNAWATLLVKERFRLLQPRPNIDDDKMLGSHAKILIVDNKHAYIGSANLTHPGLAGNLEMGVLVHGEIAAQAGYFLKYLIEIGFLVDAL